MNRKTEAAGPNILPTLTVSAAPDAAPAVVSPPVVVPPVVDAPVVAVLDEAGVSVIVGTDFEVTSMVRPGFTADTFFWMAVERAVRPLFFKVLLTAEGAAVEPGGMVMV